MHTAAAGCNTGQTTTTVSHLVRVFTKLQHQLRADVKTGTSSYKVKHYTTLIKQLEATRGLDDVVKSADEFASLPHFGKGTLDRIAEIIQTGTLKEIGSQLLDEAGGGSAADSNELAELRALQQVTGIGPAKAKSLLAGGFTLARLLDPTDEEARAAKLTDHQRLGVKYFDDLQSRVLRPSIEAFDEKLKLLLPSQMRATVCGSYRRGASSSGDIDVLLDGGQDEASVLICLRECVSILRSHGFLLDDLIAAPKTKYMGFARAPGRAEACRLDIRAVPTPSYIPSLLYFTGSKDENVRVRKALLQKGMRLNEYALTRLEDGAVLPLTSESEVYETYLQEPYKPPTAR